MGERDVRAISFECAGQRYAVVSFPCASREYPAVLTAAEREVTALLLEGASNAEIAATRRTSERTVANQVASILRKLGVAGRSEVPLALSEGAGD